MQCHPHDGSALLAASHKLRCKTSNLVNFQLQPAMQCHPHDGSALLAASRKLLCTTPGTFQGS
jgi:hypothetical protein